MSKKKSANHPNATRSKYRPVLTAPQLQHIAALAKLDVATIESPTRDMSFSVISTLAPFIAKIENAAMAPSYTIIPKVAIYSLEALGGEPTLSNLANDESIGTPETIPALYATKEARWAAAYAKYVLNPISCTLVELEDANEHMYLEGLMTP